MVAASCSRTCWLDLFCGWQHHWHELIGKNCWYNIFSNDNAPECQLFVKLREAWPLLDKDVETNGVDLPEDEKNKLILFFKELLEKENYREELFFRNDYRELVEVCLHMLGAELSGQEFKWRKINAVHKARFMAYAINGLKA